VVWLPIWILIMWVPTFQALHCFTPLQEGIAILLSVYMHWILTFGDCFTDSSLILVFVWVFILADYQSVDGSVTWQTSFNFNHTPHAGILPSTGHCRVDPRRSCCSACPVLQRRIHFVGRQKATQIVLPPETNQ